MKDKITLKIAEAVVKSAPRFTEDADLLNFQIARDLNLKSEAELAFCKHMVNNAIGLCKQGKGSDLKRNESSLMLLAHLSVINSID
tara:strand:+ start:90 stop:347 length:258 start_codon:yes stop_codon:yes gene_type:complete